MIQTDTNVAALTFSALSAMVQEYEIQYPENLSVKAKKAFKLKVLRDSPETLKADFAVDGSIKTITNYIFFTHHPAAWHAALCQCYVNVQRSGISKGRRITVHEDEDLNSPYLTVNIFHNGTVMAQGSKNSLENFQQTFQTLKELVKKKTEECNSDINATKTSPQTTIKCPAENSHPVNDSLSPKMLNDIRSIKENIHKLEREFIEFKDRMSDIQSDATAQQKESVQPRDELWTMVRQQRDEIKELHAALRELEEDNQDLRTELRRVKEMLQHSRQQDMDTIRQEWNELKETLPNHRVTTAGSMPSPDLPTFTKDEDKEKKGENLPQKDMNSDPEIVLLCDSNGKYINMRRLFPSSNAVKIKSPHTTSALMNLQKMKTSGLKHLIIHTGTNDITASRTHSVVKGITEVVTKARETFPDTQITLSAILPRSDTPHHIIREINKGLYDACSNIRNVDIIQHDDISSKHLFDPVHLNKKGVSLLAKEIKDCVLKRKRPPIHRGRSDNTPRTPRPTRPTDAPHSVYKKTIRPQNYNNPRDTNPLNAPNPPRPRAPDFKRSTCPKLPTGVPMLRNESHTNPSYASVLAKPVDQNSNDQHQIRELVTLLCQKLLC